jgi:hypothetical protein
MTKPFFTNAAKTIARAANQGTVTVGLALASDLGARSHGLDGTVTISLEGANAVAHEFGTLSSPARPVLSPALRARRREVTRAVAAQIGKALKAK